MTSSRASEGGPGARPGHRARTLPGQRLVNLLVRALLRTPGFCRIIGSRLVTLYVVGRKTGRRYAIPVACLLRGDDLLIGTSSGWARNLRSGEPVGIRLKGRRLWADVRISTKESEVVPAYAHMSRTNPTFARFNSLRLGEDGEPDRDDFRLAWQGGARALRLTPVM
ncbi:hypothetical protein ABT186_38150 [Streptomyces sp. NPDC001634]|uniref:hypothetical protein n=1 Tax=Streptomyces sp. NPDC001634 TaxID=3154390 RepID=UPI00331E32AB